MNYKALFAAMQIEIAKRKLTSAQISELAGVHPATLSSWVAKGIKPAHNNTVKSFLKLVDMLKINLDGFADAETAHGRIELLRWKNNMTILELSKSSQCNPTTVCDYESGRCSISSAKQKTIQNFAAALNTTTDYILNGEPKKEVRNALVDVPKVAPVEVQSASIKEKPVDLAGIVADAKAVGALLYTKNGGLFAGNSSVVSAELRQRLLDNKQALIEFLTPLPLESEVPKIEVVEDAPKPFEIEIYIKNIGDNDVNAVNARELWAKLESKQDFSDWIKARIQKYDFVSGVDWVNHKIMDNLPTGGRPTIDYFISLDMAKELSMVENNAQGKIARRYFIECEKAAKGATPKFDHLSPEVIATLKQARTVQLAMGMTKTQSSKYARDLIQDRFGFDMERATTGIKNEQLQLRIVK